jgi:hypothetical protein
MTDGLHTPPLSSLLAELFAESERSDARWGELLPSERAAFESLARDVPADIELVLLDGAKVLYPKIDRRVSKRRDPVGRESHGSSRTPEYS